MYQYTAFDRAFVRARAAEFRDQLGRWQAGALSDNQFRPLRLQNGWYVQRYAPMLRVAVPYGEISAAQLKVLARIAREYDTPDAAPIPVKDHAGAVSALAFSADGATRSGRLRRAPIEAHTRQRASS